MNSTEGADSSSGEEDGDEEWKAAIGSVSAVDAFSTVGFSKSQTGSSCVDWSTDGRAIRGGGKEDKKVKSPGLKLYQIKFRRQIKSVAVNGPDVVAAAILNCEKSWARWEAKEFAAKEAAKKEEERVAELKRIRGEKWLPSVARAMQEK
ncbi:hypothetical protein HPP92_024909 [Vanilla planifolia]|uniref:Uncharacterized protein n=1 Tax=Vanilla planifolia TaxID=51239 RepID=A0A835UBL6_VANPL|nr:hypothetical protein HPP92_024909 [Vanilla planifolia]